MGNQCKQQPKKSKVIQEQDERKKQVKEKSFTFGITFAENENQYSIQQTQLNSLLFERSSLRVELEKPYKLQNLREESVEWFSDISESFEIFSHQHQSFDNFFHLQSQEQARNLNNECETRNKSKSIQPQKLPLYYKQQTKVKVRNQRIEQLEKEKKNTNKSYKSENSITIKNINEKLLFSPNDDVHFNFFSERSLKLQQQKKNCSNFTTDTNSFKKISKESLKLNNDVQIEHNSKFQKKKINKQNTLQQLLKSTKDISSNLDILKTPKILK